MAHGHSNKSRWRLLLLEVRRGRFARRRTNGEHRVHFGSGWLPRAGKLLGGQGGRDRFDKGVIEGVGETRHHGERGRPRCDPDADDLRDQARRDGRIREANPGGPDWPPRRRGPCGPVPGERGKQLHYGNYASNYGRLVLKKRMKDEG